MILNKNDIRRFFSKVKILENGCHQWTGGIASKRYGKFWDGMYYQLAHRVAFFIKHGKLDRNKVIDHLCKNKLCVNPEHLREVSSRDNTLAKHSDSPSAINFRKTHCKNGHEFTQENTSTRMNGIHAGTRRCKQCDRDSTKRYYLKNV